MQHLQYFAFFVNSVKYFPFKYMRVYGRMHSLTELLEHLVALIEDEMFDVTQVE